MTVPPGSSPARTALLIYLAMIAAVSMVLLMSVGLRAAGVFPPGASSAALAALPLAVAGGAVLVFVTVRRRLPERRPGESLDQWWRANLPGALTLWATAEGAALAGAALYLVGGHATSLAATALGMALLAFSAPATLADR